ncbi:S-layer homology domain-containing protein [Viridibacillus arvi]|uniref:S-layer homology domain-containing protein n=1 Tax=Viridibacillus arvi TaxID=263475 RepID=UPI00187B51BC|nr:S-layer homology domain-containing protein [Viridibacillus sp. JNUCC-6]QOV10432.1 S-layer homology domain-containing protein [Viridibacillus sp. JNUCC-6]
MKSRTFKGVSNVLPTAITNLTPSLQGVIGKEVTVKTQVDVPAGQSKEGIAVTFNITNSADTSQGNFGKKITAEVFTDANGVASYSYTQYVAGTDDTVEAYPTGNASVKATAAKVYWGNTERLTITEVTEGNALANGSKKVYKVKAQNYATAYDANNKALYNYVNVAFAENVNVTPDKLVRGASIEDTGISGNASYPSQVTTGGVNKVQVKLDANGEATFTVTGSNAAVTPIVFVDAGSKGDKLDSTELQAKAATVTFALSHTLGLAVKAEGVQNAAAINTGNANNKGTGEGGRTYTVTVTDKDGKVAPAGTKAYVTFAEGSYSVDKKAYILNGTSRVVADKTVRHEISVTGTKGEATFTLVGDHDAYAAPTIYLENGKEFGLDKADLQTVGETTYFVNAVVNNALLTVVDADGKEVTTLPTTKTAFFNYDSVDQNEFEYFTGTGNYEVSYQVTAHFADVTANGKVVKKGTTETIKVNASAGKAVLAVTSENVGSNVTVNASASQASLPNKTASIAFTKGSELPAIHTGVVSAIDTAKQTITLGTTYDAVSYANATFKNDKGVEINKSTFESLVSKGTTVTYKKDGDKVSFEIVAVTGSEIDATVLAQVNAATTEADVLKAIKGLNEFKALNKKGQDAVVADIFATQPLTGKTLKAAFAAYVAKVDSAIYSAPIKEVTGVTGVKAASKEFADKAGKKFKVETVATTADYNGIKINFTATGASTTTTSYDSKTKILTVDLKSTKDSVTGVITVTADYDGVKAAIDAFNGAGKLVVTQDGANATAEELLAVTLELTGGVTNVTAVTATDGKLVLTTSEAVKLTDSVNSKVKVNGVEGTAVVSGTTVTITLAKGAVINSKAITSLEGIEVVDDEKVLDFSGVEVK